MKVAVVVAWCLTVVANVQGRPQDAVVVSQNEVETAPESLPEVISEVIPVQSDSSQEDAVILSIATPVPILVDQRESNVYGAYSFWIEQGDGIIRKESAAPTGPEGQMQTVGQYSFVHPNGTVHTLSYVADENGFQPFSNMLPTPHPLEPWHLEQIAFAEAEKRRLAPEEAISTPAAEDSISAPAVEEVPSVPVAEESASAQVAQEAVSAPAAKDFTSATAAEKSVLVPAEESASAPAEKSASVATEESVSAPAEESVSAPAEESASAPAEEFVSAPAEESASAPAEESVSAPAEEPASAPSEDSTSASAPAEGASAPTAAAAEEER